MNGTQLAALYNDGTVIAWSYPSGEILFQMKGNKGGEIKWNPLRQDVFATRQEWLVRNAVDSLFDSPVPYFLLTFYLEADFFSSLFPDEKKLLLWNTRANGDATKENLFHTLQRDVRILKVEWISENRIALMLGNGLIEIWEIDGEGNKNKSRVIKQIKHKYVSIGISTIFQFVINFAFFLLKVFISVTDLKWNEMTENLAASSSDGFIKVKFHSFDANWLTNGNAKDKR